MPNIVAFFQNRFIATPVNATEVAIARLTGISYMVDVCNVSRISAATGLLTLLYVNEPCSVADLNAGNDPGNQEVNRSLNAKQLAVRSTTTLVVDDQVVHQGHTYVVYAVLTDRTPNLANNVLMRLVSA